MKRISYVAAVIGCVAFLELTVVSTTLAASPRLSTGRATIVPTILQEEEIAAQLAIQQEEERIARQATAKKRIAVQPTRTSYFNPFQLTRTSVTSPAITTVTPVAAVAPTVTTSVPVVAEAIVMPAATTVVARTTTATTTVSNPVTTEAAVVAVVESRPPREPIRPASRSPYVPSHR